MTTPRSRLRVIRANAQALQRSVAHLGGADDEFNARFPSEQVLWDENAGEIETDFQTIRTELAQGVTKADIEDDVEAVRNAWSEARGVQGLPGRPRRPGDAHRALAADRRAAARHGARDRHAHHPAAGAEYLAQERSGGAFHFHTASRTSCRSRPTGWPCSSTARRARQAVRARRRRVRRHRAFARSPWRLRSYVLAAAVLILGAVLAWFAHDIAASLKIDTAFAPRESLLGAYVLVLVGVIGHILLDVYKRAQSRDTDSPVVLDELFLWGSIHEVQLLTTALGVWAGTLILASLENPISPWSALVTGYSLDSILDAGIRRLDATVTKATTDLTGKFSDGSGGT